MRPEEQIEKKYQRKAEGLGVKSVKFEVHGEKGAPDRMVFLPGGEVIFFEFKRPDGGQVAYHQEVFMEELSSLGYECYVVDSWEEPIKILKDKLNGK